MTVDLSRALLDAATRATTGLDPVAHAPEVLRRVHRRRTVRAATTGAVSVAATGAVVLGGLQLLGRGTPVPPATSPTGTPAPAVETPEPSTPTPPSDDQATTPDRSETPPDDGATAPPAVTDLVLGFDGFEQLPLGTVLAGTTSPSPLVEWDAGYCYGLEEPGRWVPAYPEVMSPRGTPTPAFGVVRDEADRVVGIAVLGHGPRTTGGVGVGATLAEVQAAHDVERVPERDGYATQAWVARSGDRTLLVEVAVEPDPALATWPDGVEGTVVGLGAAQDPWFVQPSLWESCG